MISVILPSIRPDRIQRTLENLQACAARVDLEVLVVADYEPRPGQWTGSVLGKWMVRERRGTVHAVNVGYSASCGEFIFVTNDETTIEPDALGKLERLAHPNWLLTPRHRPTFHFTYYGRVFAPFPFASRRLFDRLGGYVFDPAYKCFYADPDLSLRARTHEITICTVHDAVITHRNSSRREGHQANIDAYFAQDQATFRRRWDHLGEFKDP